LSYLKFASWIEGDSGLTTVVKILVGCGKRVYQQKSEEESELQGEIEELELKAFAKVVVAPDFHVGAQTLFQSFGIGAIRPNTVLLNGPEQLMDKKDHQGQRLYGQYLSEAFRLGSNVVIFNALEERWDHVDVLPSQDRRIDVWWWDDATSRLMLLFAYLMTRKDEWNEALIRVLAPAESKGARKNLNNLTKTLEDVRIDARPEIIVEPTIETVVEQSAEAACTFLPLRVRGKQLVSPLGFSFDEILSRIPLGSLVIAAEDIDLEAEPEEGKQGEIAAALDAVTDADRRAKEKEKEAIKSTKFAEEMHSEMKKASATQHSQDKLAEVKASLRDAEKMAKKAAREAEKARENADEATKVADQLVKKAGGANKDESTEQLPKKGLKEVKTKKGKRVVKK